MSFTPMPSRSSTGSEAPRLSMAKIILANSEATQAARIAHMAGRQRAVVVAVVFVSTVVYCWWVTSSQPHIEETVPDHTEGVASNPFSPEDGIDAVVFTFEDGPNTPRALRRDSLATSRSDAKQRSSPFTTAAVVILTVLIWVRGARRIAEVKSATKLSAATRSADEDASNITSTLWGLFAETFRCLVVGVLGSATPISWLGCTPEAARIYEQRHTEETSHSAFTWSGVQRAVHEPVYEATSRSPQELSPPPAPRHHPNGRATAMSRSPAVVPPLALGNLSSHDWRNGPSTIRPSQGDATATKSSGAWYSPITSPELPRQTTQLPSAAGQRLMNAANALLGGDQVPLSLNGLSALSAAVSRAMDANQLNWYVANKMQQASDAEVYQRAAGAVANAPQAARQHDLSGSTSLGLRHQSMPPLASARGPSVGRWNSDGFGAPFMSAHMPRSDEGAPFSGANALRVMGNASDPYAADHRGSVGRLASSAGHTASSVWTVLGIRDLPRSTVAMRHWVACRLGQVCQDIEACDRFFQSRRRLAPFDCTTSLLEPMPPMPPDQPLTGTPAVGGGGFGGFGAMSGGFGTAPTGGFGNLGGTAAGKHRKLDLLLTERQTFLAIQPPTADALHALSMIELRLHLDAILDIGLTFPSYAASTPPATAATAVPAAGFGAAAPFSGFGKAPTGGGGGLFGPPITPAAATGATPSAQVGGAPLDGTRRQQYIIRRLRSLVTSTAGGGMLGYGAAALGAAYNGAASSTSSVSWLSTVMPGLVSSLALSGNSTASRAGLGRSNPSYTTPSSSGGSPLASYAPGEGSLEDGWSSDMPCDAAVVIHVLARAVPAIGRHVQLAFDAQPGGGRQGTASTAGSASTSSSAADKDKLTLCIGHMGEPYFFVKYARKRDQGSETPVSADGVTGNDVVTSASANHWLFEPAGLTATGFEATATSYHPLLRTTPIHGDGQVFSTVPGRDSLFQALLLLAGIVNKYHGGTLGGVLGMLDLEALGLHATLSQ